MEVLRRMVKNSSWIEVFKLIATTHVANIYVTASIYVVVPMYFMFSRILFKVGANF